MLIYIFVFSEMTLKMFIVVLILKFKQNKNKISFVDSIGFKSLKSWVQNSITYYFELNDLKET